MGAVHYDFILGMQAKRGRFQRVRDPNLQALEQYLSDPLAGTLFISCSGSLISGGVTGPHMRIPEKEIKSVTARGWDAAIRTFIAIVFYVFQKSRP